MLSVTSGEGIYNYEWSNGEVQSNVSNTESEIQNLCPGDYSVIVSNVNYCNLTDTISINLGSLEGGTLDLGDDAMICEGETIVLSALGFESVVWQDGSTDENFIVEESGTYSVDVIDSEGCSYNDAIAITLNEAPNASYTASPQTTTIDDTEITFTMASADNQLNYSWSFEDGIPNVSSEANPVVNFPAIPGSYNVSLIIENENACRDTLRTFIIIESDGTVTLPNIFTPNGDGDNDRFIPLEDYPGDWKLTIFNRWGLEIFTTENLFQGWSGEGFPDGTYYWILQPRNGQLGTAKSGYVSLVKGK
ncbi:MAG: gliding motility-associated C-terminal domain-containing protein [Flavobacteriales bacterium]